MSQRTFERIKNYSTSVPVERTVAEIEKMLAAHGATKILKEYLDEKPVGLSFVIKTLHGPMPVRMPVRIEKVREVFKVEGNKHSKRYWEGEWAEQQAARVAWRILRDWLDAQLALIRVEMTSITEIFLPYVYSEKLDRTIHDLFEEGRLAKALGDGKEWATGTEERQ